MLLLLNRGDAITHHRVIIVLLNGRNEAHGLGGLQLSHIRGLHTFPFHLIHYVVADLIREHVDDSAQTLLVLDVEIFVVEPNDYVE